MKKYAHIMAKGILVQAVMFDVPAVAVCGKIWHPDPELPLAKLDDVCPACASIIIGTPFEKALDELRSAVEGGDPDAEAVPETPEGVGANQP